MNPIRSKTPRLVAAALLSLALAGSAAAQVEFSVDRHSPLLAGGATEGDLLAPATGMPMLAPAAGPVVSTPAASLGLITAGCAGGGPCQVEVDALSRGNDAAYRTGLPAGVLWFSVERRSFGSYAAAHATVNSESPLPVSDAGGDVFVSLGPSGTTFMIDGNAGAIDGDGLASGSGHVYPGLGLAEPVIVCGLGVAGDNLDALDLEGGGFPVFFSLDASPAVAPPCPLSGSAAAHGFSGAAVLRKAAPGAPLVVYAPAGMLGLDPVNDDLDALAILENGIPGFQITPSYQNPPPQWGQGSAHDMLIFSVRKGSAILGVVDSLRAQPIEPGDLLVPPPLGAVVPGILVPAENLGLQAWRLTGGPPFDDLDALDLTTKALFDCNGNGVEDAVDVASGTSLDANSNGVPDECESAVSYCTAGVSASGCQALLSASGVASASTGSGFVVAATDVEASKNGMFYYGSSRMAAPWAPACPSILRCVAAPVHRTPLTIGVGTPGTCEGTFSMDLNAYWSAHPAKRPPAGSLVDIQLWYRDPFNPCFPTWWINRTNFSDALELAVGP